MQGSGDGCGRVQRPTHHLGLFCEDCFGETPKPTRETRALPGKRWERHSARDRTERAEFARYPPSLEVITGSFFRRKRNQLFQVFRMLSRGVR